MSPVVTHSPVPATQEPATAALSAVSTVLWRERELLELLLFKLEEEQLVLASGRTRWLARATNEVEMVLEEIRRTELQRALDVQRAAAALDLTRPDPSLRDLVTAAPSPWAEIFADHRNAFLAATGEIASVAESNRELLTTSYQAVRETLASLAPSDADTYAPPGRRRVQQGPQLVDRVM